MSQTLSKFKFIKNYLYSNIKYLLKNYTNNQNLQHVAFFTFIYMTLIHTYLPVRYFVSFTLTLWYMSRHYDSN